MLFNSYEFVFAFLPVTVIVYLLLRSVSRPFALGWVILASILFYAWWRPFNLLIIGPAIAVNYLCARVLLALAGDEAKQRAKNAVLALGIAFNIGVLGYFKYANFAVDVVNDVAGTDFVLAHIILPLGISFITFQKIAFLMDVAGQRVKSFTARDFLLFVLFFPQLIAGPIVHYRETISQFHDAPKRISSPLFAAAMSLFVFGLFKKVVLADGIAPHVSPIYEFVSDGGQATLVQAWLASVGFTLQIYFDFSGYSDMACGAALLFGVRLPLNFNSPLQAANIIDFWQRWHVTLTRFLTAYVYNPISLAMTRRRAAEGKGLLRSSNAAVPAFIQVLAGPTLLTMLLSGVWHGAGYTFIIWGALHGGFLVVNHAWRQYVEPRGAALNLIGRRTAAFLGWAVTFLCVAASMVFFRAPDTNTAVEILRGMMGLNGVSLPQRIAELIQAPGVPLMMLGANEVYAPEFLKGMAYLAGLFAIAMFMPNTLQVLSRQEPVLHPPTRPPRIAGTGPAVHWRPSLVWMVFIAALAALSVTLLGGESEFLYWQF